ncbi:O-acetyltransferase [Clostridium polyendosporum]|uniref:O-acetyltransferase n=1 Tax=Clostridium polyendosporum TaxID=69208 RepID=A0A919S2R5_9CLOT|nr:acyltransferase family protein [Clostridium polyendosporum]GIM30163.1 O-acetyltransferase [Clostridium polyendosporum]
MQTQRLDWIDMAKGLGMILVMITHAPIPDQFKQIIYTFHMPLFFFLSGYLFSISKYNSFLAFFKRKFKSLVIPYFTLSFINYMYWISTNGPYNYSTSIYKPFVGTFYALRRSEWSLHNGTMWFVTCLFITEILFYIIIKSSKNNNIIITICLIISSVAGHLYSAYIGQAFPWSIDVSITAVVFFGAAYLIRCKGILLNVNVGYLVLFIVVNAVAGYLNFKHIGKPTDMFFNRYGNYFLFYIGAFSGVLAYIMLIKLLPKINFLEYIGKNSIIFLAFHQFILFPNIEIVLKHINIFSGKDYYSYILLGTTYALVSSVILIPVSFIITKYMPYLLGKAYQINGTAERRIKVFEVKIREL